MNSPTARRRHVAILLSLLPLGCNDPAGSSDSNCDPECVAGTETGDGDGDPGDGDGDPGDGDGDPGDGDGDPGDGDGDPGDGDGAPGDGDGDPTGDGDGAPGDGDGDPTGDGDGDPGIPFPDTGLAWYVDIQRPTEVALLAAADGGAYVAGAFAGDLLVDEVVELSAGAAKRSFVMRISPQGAVQWVTEVQHPTANLDPRDHSLARLDDGTIVLGGTEYQDGWSIPDSGFVALIGSNGTLETVRSQPAGVEAIAAHGTDIYTCGRYRMDPIDVGCGLLHDPNNSPYESFFFARHQRDGTCTWSNSSTNGEPLSCEGIHVAANASARFVGQGDCFRVDGILHNCGNNYPWFFANFDPGGVHTVWTQTQNWSEVWGFDATADGGMSIAGITTTIPNQASGPYLAHMNAAATYDGQRTGWEYWWKGVASFDDSGAGWWMHGASNYAGILFPEGWLPPDPNPSPDEFLTLLHFDNDFTITHAHRWWTDGQVIEAAVAAYDDEDAVVAALTYWADPLMGSPMVILDPSPPAVRIEKHTAG